MLEPTNKTFIAYMGKKKPFIWQWWIIQIVFQRFYSSFVHEHQIGALAGKGWMHNHLELWIVTHPRSGAERSRFVGRAYWRSSEEYQDKTFYIKLP